MLNITKQKFNNIYYECDCGAGGVCSFRPAKKDTALVVNLICPVCEERESITIVQYKNEEERDSLIENMNNLDLSWAPSFSEEI